MAETGLRGKENHLKVLILSITSLAIIGSVKILFNMIVGRSFGANSVEVLGMSSVVLSLAFLITTLCSTGYSNVASKFISDALAKNKGGHARRVFDRIIRNTVILALISAAIVGALAPELSTILNVDLIYFAFAVPIIVVASLYYVIRATYYALGAVSAYFRREIFADAAFFAVLAGVILLGPAGLILLSFVIMYMIFLVLSFSSIHKRLPSDHTKTILRMKEEHAFAGLSTLGTVMSVAVIYLGTLLIGAIMGAYSAGIFAAALTTANLALLIENGFTQVLIPEIAFLWGGQKSDKLHKYIMTWTMVLQLSAALFIGPLVIMSRDILNLMFGAEYLVGANTAIIMLFGIYMLTIARTSVSALASTDKIRVVVNASVLAFIAAAIAWTILIPLLGIEGGALGYIVACSFDAIIPLAYARKKWNLDLKPLIIPNLSFIIPIIAIIVLVGQDDFFARGVATVLFVLTYIAINYHKIRNSMTVLRNN